MCGIIGYVGNKDIESVLVVGLEKLSYRGYDSSGIAVLETRNEEKNYQLQKSELQKEERNKGEISVWKKQGKLAVLRKTLDKLQINGHVGIGHTRWATHGTPNDLNAHPHLSKSTGTAIVHNGIIENHYELKKKLQELGYIFCSETDSECIAHLIDYYLQKKSNQTDVFASLKPSDFVTEISKNRSDGNADVQNSTECFRSAFLHAVALLKGAYAIAAISEFSSECILVARNGSPIFIGENNEQLSVASDLQSLTHLSKKYYSLQDGEIAQLEFNKVRFYNAQSNSFGVEIVKKATTFQAEDVHLQEGKNGYSHFMLKEIFQQPSVVAGIVDSYVKKANGTIDIRLGSFNEKEIFSNVERFLFQACGTSYHAALVAKYWIEEMARVQVEVDISSEFRYRHPFTKPSDVVVALSQSGETADTLACIREAKSCLLRVLSFVNVKNSSIDIESDAVIFTKAGIEIGVASTKNYVAQLACLYLFAIKLALMSKKITPNEAQAKIEQLEKIPALLTEVLQAEEKIKGIAKRYAKSKAFLFIGRGLSYPAALEGALKLKEISYIHATGYAAGELKHGPIALIDEDLPVVCLVPKSPTYEKMLSNLQEVKSRKGIIIAVGTQGDEEVASLADEYICIPKMLPELLPIVAAVPLQLLSYHVALELGTDVDQPKNLAKSVTVE